MAQDFFSACAINEEVTFIPMFSQQESMGIANEILEGKVMAVRFTEAKVFYDIYNAVIGIADFFIFLFDMLVFIVSSIVAVFSYLINQFTYIYTVLPPFLSGLIVLNLIVVLIITFVFGLEIFSTKLGGSD